MEPKDYLTNRNFCPIPWTGLMYNFDGNVKTCIRSSAPIGNIREQDIEQILNGENNQATRIKMLNNEPGERCDPCYELEQGGNKFDIISDRVFYLRELKQVPLGTYDKVDAHRLEKIDVRWTNLCNFSCVYCNADFSSQWANELGVKIDTPNKQQRDDFKAYIFKHVDTLKHVYMAGGEPLLMKENEELLEKLLLVNPDVNLRINTNLSHTNTRVFDLACKFKNVHWTVSAETMGDEYDYIRHGGQWATFCKNLRKIKDLDHKITFNMLYFVLNPFSVFKFVDKFMNDWNFHPNAFVIGPLLFPEYLNIRHLPNKMLQLVKQQLEERIAEHPGFLLENSYQNLLKYIQQPFKKNLTETFKQLAVMDARRGVDSSKIFIDLYKEK
jgi:MoaA/NifB/PqqE/SkfB family radical SAM enzyme